jgi:hypothetical protein
VLLTVAASLIASTLDRCTRCPRHSPIPIRSPASISEDATVSAASFTNTNMQLDLRGRGFRQGQCPPANGFTIAQELVRHQPLGESFIHGP